MKIALISCTKLKQNYRCEAQEMYKPSQLFSKILRYIKIQNYDKWFILSAKYELLKPNEIIEPYNISLNNMNKKEKIHWSNNVFKQLIKYKPDLIDFYAGENYRKYLIPLIEDENIIYYIPLKGLGIGKQMQWLNNRMEENK